MGWEGGRGFCERVRAALALRLGATPDGNLLCVEPDRERLCASACGRHAAALGVVPLQFTLCVRLRARFRASRSGKSGWEERFGGRCQAQKLRRVLPRRRRRPDVDFVSPFQDPVFIGGC